MGCAYVAKGTSTRNIQPLETDFKRNLKHVDTMCSLSLGKQSTAVYAFSCLWFRAVQDLTLSNPPGAGDGSGFRENVFSDHRTIRLMNLMA